MKKILKQALTGMLVLALMLGMSATAFAASARDRDKEYAYALAAANELYAYADDYGWGLQLTNCKESDDGTYIQTKFSYNGSSFTFYVLATPKYKVYWYYNLTNYPVEDLQRWLKKYGGEYGTAPAGHIDARTADAAQGQEVVTFRTEIRDLNWSLEMDNVQVVSCNKSGAEAILTFTKPGWKMTVTQKLTANTTSYVGAYGSGFIAKYYVDGVEYPHEAILRALKNSN